MMQQKDSLAMQQFAKSADWQTTNKIRRAKSFHNMGVIMQNHQEFAKAIECYKMALRNNPQDNETRYNLALCMRQQKKNKQNKDKQQQKKKQQNKGENKSKEKKEQDKNQKQQQQKQQEKMSKENAEQMLNAAMQQEQQTQQRIKDAMRQNRSRKLQKNW